MAEQNEGPMEVTDEMREREKLFAAALRKVQEGITPTVLTEIMHERVRQEVKWGEQNHEFAPECAVFYGVPRSGDAKKACDAAMERGDVTFGDILTEEIAEALDAETEEEQRYELVQVAAVAVAAIEAMDRKRLKGKLDEKLAEMKAAQEAEPEEAPEPEAYEEFTVSTTGKVTKNFDIVRPMSVVEEDRVEAWEKQVRGEIAAYLESVGITEVSDFEIIPKPVPTFGIGDAVVASKGGNQIDVAVVVRQEGETVFAFSTYEKKVTDYDARRLVDAPDEVLDMMVNDETEGGWGVMSYRDMVERARKECLS